MSPMRVVSPNDVACPHCGRESCDGQHRRWQHAGELVEANSPEPVVEGVAWSGSITVLVGESGASKTFVLLDIGAAVSAGLPWHGRKTVEGCVVYIGYEGHVGLRLRALMDVAGHSLAHVYVVSATEPLSPVFDRTRSEVPSKGEIDAGRDLAEIAAEVAAHGAPPVRLLIIDTIRASMAGSENDSEAASAYLRAVRRVMLNAPGAACILAHHAGWQDGEQQRQRERGSSAFRGNVDGTLFLEAGKHEAAKGEAQITLKTLKVRDGETLPPLRLVRRRVAIPGAFDRWGRPATSCIIESDVRTAEDVAREAEDALDARAMEAIAAQSITSARGMQAALGIRKESACASVRRLTDRRWILKPAPALPFALSAAGSSALEEFRASGSRRFPMVPGNRAEPRFPVPPS